MDASGYFPGGKESGDPGCSPFINLTSLTHQLSWWVPAMLAGGMVVNKMEDKPNIPSFQLRS
jgi:hypothetical protein